MNGGFPTFGVPHLAAIGLTVAVPVALCLAVRRGSPAVGNAVRYGLAATLLLNEFAWWTIRVVQIGFDGFLRNHLPLHLCGVAVFLTAVTLIFRRKRAYEIAWFWGMVGAGSAVLTPGNIDVGFPAYRFFQYFIAHGGIVAGVAVATWGLGMRPSLGGLFRAFLYMNLLAVPVAIANLLLGSNYMFLSSPPGGSVSPFFFAPWPWYLLFLEMVGLGMFLLAYLPFVRWRRWYDPA